MAKQTFTSGQVLTAAQVNALQANDYNQTVSNKTASYTLVAADKGTRIVMNDASATAITVNTSLFDAGDTLFIQNIGAGVCTITAGTATVTSSASLALVQYASGTLFFTSASEAIFIASAVTATASGMVFVTGASFSAQSSVGMAGVSPVDAQAVLRSPVLSPDLQVSAARVVSDCLRIAFRIAFGLPSDCHRIAIGLPFDYLRIAFGLPSDCPRWASLTQDAPAPTPLRPY